MISRALGEAEMAENIARSEFEEGYLLRDLGAVSRDPAVALSELVANAWDAGAKTVTIEIPDEAGQVIAVSDDGAGLTAEEFHHRWMKHGYNRLRHQGSQAELVPGSNVTNRRAYGRNGIGRHGLLCFADRYFVETRKHDEKTGTLFEVEPSSGDSAFVLKSETPCNRSVTGTRIYTTVQRALPSAEEILDSLSFKFLHDPQFTIVVNDIAIKIENQRIVEEKEIQVCPGVVVQVLCYEIPPTKKKKAQNGVSFWVGGRLVGDPMYNLFGYQLLDGRRSMANRNIFVVKTDDLFDDIEPDWSDFKKTHRTQRLADEVGGYIDSLTAKLNSGKIEENKSQALRDNKDEIKKLKPLGRIEVSEFVDNLVTEHPNLQVEILTSAVKAAVNLEKSRSGQMLLDKLATITEDDVERLNKILDNWTLRDALSVLDEIDRRISVAEAIDKLKDDPTADELHTIHPLVTHARWIFGPEFESPLYSSNVSIQTAAATVFKKKIDPTGIANPRQRPDLIFLKGSTLSLTGTEVFDESGTIIKLQNLLVIELKKGNFTITQKEIQQAVQYVLDLLNCKLLDGAPYVRAFVVGHKIDKKVRAQSIGEQPIEGKVEAITFSQLVSTAKHRLFRLQDTIGKRYKDVPGLRLVDKILGESQQLDLFDKDEKKKKKTRRTQSPPR